MGSVGARRKGVYTLTADLVVLTLAPVSIAAVELDVSPYARSGDDRVEGRDKCGQEQVTRKIRPSCVLKNVINPKYKRYKSIIKDYFQYYCCMLATAFTAICIGTWALTFAVVAVWWIAQCRAYVTLRSLGLPTPPRRARPFFGHVNVSMLPHQLYETMREESGSLVAFMSLYRPSILISDAALVQRVLSDAALRKPRSFTTLSSIWGVHGLLVQPGGDSWRLQRALTHKAYHAYGQAAMYARVTRQVRRVLDFLDDRIEDQLDLVEVLQLATLSLLVDFGLGNESVDVLALQSATAADARELLECREFCDAIVRLVQRRGSLANSLPYFGPTILRWQCNTDIECVDGYLRGAIDRHIAEQNDDKHDFISLLLASRNDDGQTLTRSQVRDQIVTLFAGGIDSSAASLAWALLDEPPADVVEETVRARYSELEEEEEEKKVNEELWTPRATSRLAAVDALLEQTLQAHPAVFTVTRTVESLDGFALSPTVHVPPGVSLVCLLRHTDTHPFARATPRHCPGESLFRLYARVLLSAVIYSFRFTLVAPLPSDESASADAYDEPNAVAVSHDSLLRPSALRVTVHRRTSATPRPLTTKDTNQD